MGRRGLGSQSPKRRRRRAKVVIVSSKAERVQEATLENAARFHPPASFWSLSGGMRSNSRGTIHLTGPDPGDPVSIDTNYLGDSQDLEDLITGLSLAREIGNCAALQPFTAREVAPGPLSVAELEQFFRDGLGTHWHRSGTAKMARDAMSVVDSKLKVYGVDGLRIADASILPRVTTGNTMAPCVVIGEQAAAFLQRETTFERTASACGSQIATITRPVLAECTRAVEMRF